MYISRWISRGAALFVVASAVTIICRQTIGSDNLMAKAFAVLVVLVLYAFAWGQWQIAYNLHVVNRLLCKAVGTGACKMSVDWNSDASVTYADGSYRIEVVENDSLDVIVLVITDRMIIATKKTPAGVLVPFPGERSSDLNKMTFDEMPYSPDYKIELRRLRSALQAQLPQRGRFTP